MKKYSDDIIGNGKVFEPQRREQPNDEPPVDGFVHCMLTLENLVPFKNHPFKLYEGQRFTDMVESIRANGVLVPIIVRPIADNEGKYEILSGHNRVAAAKEAGLEYIPGVIRKGLTREETIFIVTETNLIQRSFADLKHSEKAIVLATHYEAMRKTPGYRSDLFRAVGELTSSPVGYGMKTVDKLGAQHGLSKNTIARYLRVNKLIPELKNQLDDDKIGMRAAEAISYLQAKEQEIVDDLIAVGMKISIKQADTLKAESKAAKGKLDSASIKKIFKPGYFVAKVKPVKLSGKFLSRHFIESQSTEEIESIIAEALELYFSSREK